MPNIDFGTFWTIVGNIISLISLIAAVVFFILGKKKTLLHYYKSTTSLVTEKMAKILNNRLSIDGQPIKSLSSTTIRFINSGNQRIKSSDFSEQEPLRIVLKGHLYVYDVSPGNQKLLPKVEPVNEKVLSISFENLKPRQFFSVTILHDESLNVLGELTTGNMQKFHSRFSIILTVMFTITIIESMFVPLFILDDVFNGYIIENMRASFWGNAIVAIFFVLILAGTVFVVVLFFKESFLYKNYDINRDSKPRRITDRIFRKRKQ